MSANPIKRNTCPNPQGKFSAPLGNIIFLVFPGRVIAINLSKTASEFTSFPIPEALGCECYLNSNSKMKP